MDSQVHSVQPGGGVVMGIELAWGKIRRQYLRWFRPGYVAQMRACRRGVQGGCPFDPIDPRDIKYYRNQGTYSWDIQDDPYAWRDRLPFVRAGLAELVLLTGACWLIAGGFFLLGWHLHPIGYIVALAAAVISALVIWFFRNPTRAIPQGPGEVVSPADGKIVAIEEIEDPLLGPAIEIGIFLSIFNVHANRAPIAGRVLGIEYRPGKMLNALRPESAKENERLEVRIESPSPPFQLMRVRQITGQFARRIVCWVRPGDVLQRGEMFGMIKLGSRTELVLPRTHDLEVVIKVGDRVQAGSSLLARYKSPSHE